MIVRNARKALSHDAGQGSKPRFGLGLNLPDLCYASLKLSGWLVVTTSCVIATYVVVFLMLGEFSFAGFIGQFVNFADRYLAADPARQLRFDSHLIAVSAALFGTIGFFRRHSLLPLIAGKKETVDDHS